MARTSDGTYTRVSNSFTAPVTGTPISSTHADAFFDELDTEMTDSLSRTGKGGMSADLDMNNNDINEIKTAVFKGSTSGETTIIATAIAGTTTLTLPAATDTLVGKATTDTLTNKTLTSPTINEPVILANDSQVTIRDNLDPTKQFQFQASGITAGQTRTLTIPDASATLVGHDTTQALTNKTIDPASNTITAGAYSVMVRNAATTGGAAFVKISALTDRAGFGSGDKFMIEESTGELRKVDYDDLPGAGSLGGSTGATDNRILRADGTGGATVQSSGVAIDDSGNLQMADATGISDDSGNEYVVFQKTASAVNQIDITNAATGGSPNIAATGGDANINLTLDSKGTGGVRVKGHTAGAHAPSGYIGQVISATAAAVAMTSGAAKTIVTLSLTAGNWLVFGELTFVSGGANTISDSHAAISNTTDSLGAGVYGYQRLLVTGAAGENRRHTAGPTVITVSGATDYFLVGSVTWATSTMTSNGSVTAVRIS